MNDPVKTEFAACVAREISGDAAVDADAGREMGAEDFSYMLAARPGAYLFLGQGDGPSLHHPEYDFNDSRGAGGRVVLRPSRRTRAPAGSS